MKRTLILIAVLFAITGIASADELKVGTFDTRGVALAWGRSALPDGMLTRVAEIRRQHDEAKAEGDEERAEALAAEAVALQEQIHRQVFSDAPIDEILALIEDDLPQIAEAAGVDLIVGDVLYRAPGAEVFDITLEMCAPFEPTDDTRKMIKKTIKTKPVPESELRHDH